MKPHQSSCENIQYIFYVGLPYGSLSVDMPFLAALLPCRRDLQHGEPYRGPLRSVRRLWLGAGYNFLPSNIALAHGLALFKTCLPLSSPVSYSEVTPPPKYFNSGMFCLRPPPCRPKETIPLATAICCELSLDGKIGHSIRREVVSYFYCILLVYALVIPNGGCSL